MIDTFQANFYEVNGMNFVIRTFAAFGATLLLIVGLASSQSAYAVEGPIPTRFMDLNAYPDEVETFAGILAEDGTNLVGVPNAPILIRYPKVGEGTSQCRTVTDVNGNFRCFANAPVGDGTVLFMYLGNFVFAKTSAPYER